MQPVSTRLQSAIELEGEETPVVDSGPIKHAAAEVPKEAVDTVENIDIPVTETTEIDEDTAAEAAKEVTESAVEPSPDKDDPVKNQHRQGSQKSTADDIFGTQWCVPDFPS